MAKNRPSLHQLVSRSAQSSFKALSKKKGLIKSLWEKKKILAYSTFLSPPQHFLSFLTLYHTVPTSNNPEKEAF